MKLIEARIVFTEALGKLLPFGYFLCEQASKDTGHSHSLIVGEVQRERRAAQWNSNHCRVMEGEERCERTLVQHSGRGDHDFKPIGISDSTHVSGLAADLLVMREGAIVNEPDIYRAMGEHWKGLAPNLHWGGDFIGFRDLGHFSHEWGGRR